MMIDKVLVTGSSGLIGSTAVRYFAQFSRVIGIDNNQRDFLTGENTEPVKKDLQQMSNFQFRYVDICYLDSIHNVIAYEKPDLVIHCAAQSSPQVAAEKPTIDFSINALGTVNLLESIRQHAKDAVFINLNCLEKTGITAGSKHCAELMVQEYHHVYDIKTVCFRCSNIVGTKEQRGPFLNRLCWEAKEKQKMTIPFGDTKVDFMYAWDLMRAIHMACQNTKFGKIYEIGGGIQNAILISDLVEKILHRKEVPVFQESTMESVIADLSEFSKDYSWSLTRSVDSMLDELLS